MAQSELTDPRIGTELAGYRIEALAGRGGMSVVYIAEDLALGRKVALKLMSPELSQDRRFRERFRRESRIAASIDHPNVIPIFDAGEVEGELYIAMRYVEGTDLKRLLAEEGALEPSRALGIVSAASEGIDAAHRHGLIHRDVKPSNVLIARDEEREHVYLSDFGLTRTASSKDDAIQSVQLSGTSDYAAPEQIGEGTGGFSADIYSLGCLLYECVTGRVPYPRNSELEVLWAHMDESPPRPSDADPTLPEALDQVIATAMAKEPEGRYGSGAELVAAAQEAFPAFKPASVPTRRQKTLIAALVAALLIAIAAIVAVFLLVGGEDSGTAPTTEPLGSAVQVIDAEKGELVASIPVSGADQLTTDGESVWVLDSESRTVSKIDAESRSVTSSGIGRAEPVGIASDGEAVWVLGGVDDPGNLSDRWSVTHLDAETALIDQELPATVGNAPRLLVFDEIISDGDSVWVSDVFNHQLVRIAPGRRTVLLDEVPVALAAAGQELWVAQRNGISIIDSASAAVLDVVSLEFTPSALAVTDESVWIVDRRSASLVEVNRTSRAVGERISVGGDPTGVASQERELWIVDRERNAILRFDPALGEVVETIDVGSATGDITSTAGFVWVPADATAEVGELPQSWTFPEAARGRLYPRGSGPPCLPGTNLTDCLVEASGEVLAGGLAGTMLLSFTEKRVEGGEVECKGVAYQGPVTARMTGADTGRATLKTDVGTFALTGTRSAQVYNSLGTAVRQCLEFEGVWTGVGSRVEGLTGRFLLTGPGRRFDAQNFVNFRSLTLEVDMRTSAN